MGKFNKILPVGVLSALLFGSAANAMPIPQFDKMDGRDQGSFETSLLRGAYDDLKARGMNDQATMLLAFARDKSPNGESAQFDKNLNLARALNRKNAGDPSKPVLEVENAMEVTLKHHGIEIDLTTLFASGKKFAPQFPRSGNPNAGR